MIKCNVTIIGRVFRAPEIKNDREGNPFVTFGVSTELKDNGETRDIDISVACDGEDDNVLGLSSGDRVKVKGVLIFRKREDVVFFNLSANEVNKTKEKDRIEGTMIFRGTLGNKEIQEKQGKKGAYRVFDAYSAEKIAEDLFSYIWVHFGSISSTTVSTSVAVSSPSPSGRSNTITSRRYGSRQEISLGWTLRR